MISIQLTYQHKNYWKKQGHISILGNIIIEDKFLAIEKQFEYFQLIQNESTFLDAIKKIDGHFSILMETSEYIFIAVDAIRTFPIFIKQKKNDIYICDHIVPNNDTLNIQASADFEKIYCTQENDTLLNDWLQLRAGEYVVINKEQHSVQFKSYFKHSEKTSAINIKEAERKMIANAIAYANNRTILIPLSGGYDSRYLLALLIENAYTKIECFTYGKQDTFEVNIAKKVCEQLNIKWHFIEYTDELLQSFFSASWAEYSMMNHHFTSLPHEQDFFALHYLKNKNALQKDTVVMNGFCQDLLAGSYLEPINNFKLSDYVYEKYNVQIDSKKYDNTWLGFQDWFAKNRLSKFIINSVRVYEYFDLDFYLPFWSKEWVRFWNNKSYKERYRQEFYHQYLFDGLFKKYNIGIKKTATEQRGRWYYFKKIGKNILPDSFVKYIQLQNSKNQNKDVNNTLYLYNKIYEQVKDKPIEKDFRINNIHARYFLQTLKNKYNL
ncbi:MAG: 7-cyano-7-deazaguanine synthase [Chitinophagales bacterium]|nr:7-cyano-7-deazaguanine synthase [Chitinophagales bacterium]